MRRADIAPTGHYRLWSSTLIRRRLGRWVTPRGPSDGPTLTRLSSGGSGQSREATTLLLGSRRNVRLLPQIGPLQSLGADKLRVVHETVQRATPGSNLAEGSGDPASVGRETSVRPARRVPCHAHRKVGAGPLRGHRWMSEATRCSAQHVPSASAFLRHLKVAVSSGGFR